LRQIGSMRAWRELILGLLTAATVVGGYTYYAQSETTTFLTAPAERGHIAVVVKAIGTIQAKLAVDVSSQLSGRVAEVLVDFNNEVTAGQPIARLDPESYIAKLNQAKAALEVALSTAALNRAAVERAQASLANAQASNGMSRDQLAAARIKHDETARDLQRKLYLARGGSVSESDLSRTRTQSDAEEADLRANSQQLAMKQAAIGTAQAELHMAEANVKNADAVVEQKQAEIDQAKVDLDRTVIRAPIDGIILKRDVNPGQTVAVSLEAKTLFTIANDLRHVEVQGRIDEADIGRVKVGQPVTFSVDAFPDKEFTGNVTQIRRSPEVSHNVVTYTTIVSADNPDLLLLPGMTATMRIEVSDSGPILKVPNQALRFQPERAPSAPANKSEGRATIWRPGASGEAIAVPVTIGASDSTGTAILSGSLHEGEPVIIGTVRKASRTTLGLSL
jgi:HlyD family secretion protein